MSQAQDIQRQSDRTGQDLKQVLRGDVRTDPLARAMYSTDASIYQIAPLCVVLPMDQQDVIEVLRYAREKGISVIPRGGGSGLAGESLGRGIVLDFSRYMNRVIRIDAENDEVIVQPGVILDVLNRRLAEFGKQFGPDPASGNRATIGGMIGNNSTGARSMKYGFTGDHIRQMQMVDSRGESFRTDPQEKNRQVNQWQKEIAQLLSENRQLLESARPKSDRNGSGYNVYKLLEQLRAEDPVNLSQLIAGSEGTLAIVTEARLGLVDLPRVRMLLQVQFETLGSMARLLTKLLEFAPSAVELMDGKLLELAREAYPEYHDVLPGGVGASLLLEFDGMDSAEVQSRLQQCQKMINSLQGSQGVLGTQEIIDPKSQGRIWQARKAATPLLFRNKSARQPIPVIEDVAVNPEQLAEYLDGVEAISARLGIPVIYYAHAGHGELHPRPFLNLHDPAEVRKMRQLAEEVFPLAWSLGGTISGEHGEGLVRVSFIRQQYGQDVYEVFRKIKNIFDSENRLNPGKMINDDPDIIQKDLRFSHQPGEKQSRTCLIFRDNELTCEIEQCNGNGLCRSTDSQLSMCPIFRATGDEDASPRAKGNLMRHWLYGLLDDRILETEDFKRIADLCVNCKMCAIQCPSLVNIPKLMMEARAQYVRRHGLTRAQYLLSRSEEMSRMGSVFAPLSNAFLGMDWFAGLLEKTAGLDRRRRMPRFTWRGNAARLRADLAGRKKIKKPAGRVAYFVDLYANYNDPALGRAVVDVLAHNEIEVIIPRQKGCAMPAISYGDLNYARKVIQYNVRHLAEAVRAGYSIVCSEPTAALCLKQEYLDVVDTADAHLVAENTFEMTDYLAQLHEKGMLKETTHEVPLRAARHVPCHYQSLQIEKGSPFLLKEVKGLTIESLPNSCCGIAGTFGFQKKNFDLSMQAGQPMLSALRDSACQVGLTECGTCKMQMEFGTGKKVVHPIKILACAYGLLDRDQLK